MTLSSAWNTIDEACNGNVLNAAWKWVLLQFLCIFAVPFFLLFAALSLGYAVVNLFSDEGPSEGLEMCGMFLLGALAFSPGILAIYLMGGFK
jgi:hypothetical protein